MDTRPTLRMSLTLTTMAIICFSLFASQSAFAKPANRRSDEKRMTVGQSRVAKRYNEKVTTKTVAVTTTTRQQKYNSRQERYSDRQQDHKNRTSQAIMYAPTKRWPSNTSRHNRTIRQSCEPTTSASISIGSGGLSIGYSQNTHTRNSSRVSVSVCAGCGNRYNLGTTHSCRPYHQQFRPARRVRRYSCQPRAAHTVVYYSGPNVSFRYIDPRYHKKYLFVSLGGYRPAIHRYRRYDWYGCHPYRWQGCYPRTYAVQNNHYEYYTYSDFDNIPAIDSHRLEQYERLTAEPSPAEVESDRLFEQGVGAFDAGDYYQAVDKFDGVLELSPDDEIVLFALTQALFASGQYSDAADVLLTATAAISEQDAGVFFPRGLYSQDVILQKQIDSLSDHIRFNEFDPKTQLLMGYQLMGMGDYERAHNYLASAKEGYATFNAAQKLLSILENMQQSSV